MTLPSRIWKFLFAPTFAATQSQRNLADTKCHKDCTHLENFCATLCQPQSSQPTSFYSLTNTRSWGYLNKFFYCITSQAITIQSRIVCTHWFTSTKLNLCIIVQEHNGKLKASTQLVLLKEVQCSIYVFDNLPKLDKQSYPSDENRMCHVFVIQRASTPGQLCVHNFLATVRNWSLFAQVCRICQQLPLPTIAHVGTCLAYRASPIGIVPASSLFTHQYCAHQCVTGTVSRAKVSSLNRANLCPTPREMRPMPSSRATPRALPPLGSLTLCSIACVG